MHNRTLLGFGIAAVGFAIVGFVAVSVVGLDSSFPGFPMFGGMRHGVMHGYGAGSGDDAPPAFDEAAELTVTLDDFTITPSIVTVDQGKVNLILINRGTVLHDLTIPDLGITVTAPPGVTVTAGLEFDNPGIFDTLCSVPGHASAGMTGSLKVLADG